MSEEHFQYEECPECMWLDGNPALCQFCDGADQFEEAEDHFGSPPWNGKVIRILEAA